MGSSQKERDEGRLQQEVNGGGGLMPPSHRNQHMDSIPLMFVTGLATVTCAHRCHAAVPVWDWLTSITKIKSSPSFLNPFSQNIALIKAWKIIDLKVY